MSENIPEITFLVMGGTIDAKYHPPTERKIAKKDSGIPDYLHNVIDPHFNYRAQRITMIDSLDMTDSHRADLVTAIKNSNTDQIIVTHGTDTMIETANYIQKYLPKNKKTIVFVGAMIPLDGFYHSDAPYNLGYAIAQVQNKAAGIYVCMNSHCFSPDEVYKNKTLGRFEFIEES